MLEFGYSSNETSSTKDSPFELDYGFAPAGTSCRQYGSPASESAAALPLQVEVLLTRAWAELIKAKLAQKPFADQKRRSLSFQSGKKVWLNISRLPRSTTTDGSKTLRPRHRGPLKIVAKVRGNAYRVRLPLSFLVDPVCHVSLLRKMRSRRVEPRQRPLRKDDYEIKVSSSIEMSRGPVNDGTKYYGLMGQLGLQRQEGFRT